MSKKQHNAELEELKGKYLRALADYQNLEKRTAVAVEQARIQSRKAVLVRVIDLLDDMEKAEVFLQDEGLKIIMNNFTQMLADMGVETLDLEGQEYDPETAEAVDVVAGEMDNIVTEVVQKGYRFGQDILRPAKVRVSKNFSSPVH